METMNTTNQTRWYLDDSQVYRVTIDWTIKEEPTTKTINGALFIFSPTTGKLFLKIFHKSEFDRKFRPSELAKRKTIEEVIALIQSSRVEEHPKEIIAMRQAMTAPLRYLATNYPDIVVRGTNLEPVVQAFIKVNHISELVINATESQIRFYNVYDDWMESVSAKIAFTRLLLILSAFHVSTENAKMVLNTAGGSFVSQPESFWPTLSNEQWANVEVALRNIIVSNYANIHAMEISDLTEADIFASIFGDGAVREFERLG